jgi:hypothetical protein
MRRSTLIATGFAALTVLTATVIQVTHVAEAAEVRPRLAGPSASELLAKVSGCNQISTGKYRTDMETSATVPVCGKNGIVHWTADMDIDCDGQRTAQCNEQTDPWFQPSTHWQQSDGKHLNSATLPYVVVPSSSGIWDFTRHNIDGAGVCAIIYNNKVLYAVVGDSGPNQIIGEASYNAAQRLGIDPNPKTGGTDGPVTYIFFQGSKVSPIENHGKATSVGEKLAREFISKN